MESSFKQPLQMRKSCAWNRHCPVEKNALLWKNFHKEIFTGISSTCHVDKRKTDDNEWD